MGYSLGGWLIIIAISFVLAVAAAILFHLVWWQALIVFVVAVPVVMGLIIFMAMVGWMDSGSH